MGAAAVETLTQLLPLQRWEHVYHEQEKLISDRNAVKLLQLIPALVSRMRKFLMWRRG
jgi:hypothetical protein